ncbi:MAG: T9SS type A sorting domain-containing protein [Dysgonamonadaceae bacterium]|jgi:hypothetical protein|nr:T9SS type A sorting domain-containing protein [Dysgonamonadaceae bacterium]
MKKTVLFSVACLYASVVFGQSPVVIFDGEDGQNPWWGVDATVEVVDWLQKDGTNAADPNYGATIWRSNENPGYAGGGITLDLDISAYNKISIDISKRVSGNVQVELQDGETKAWCNAYFDANGSGGYGAGTWQTLVIDIPEGWTHLTALLVAPHNVNTTENPIDFEEDNERHRMSWDNVTVYYENGQITRFNVTEFSSKIFAEKGAVRVMTEQPTAIAILSVSGILMKNETVASEKTFALPAGIYFVKTGKTVQRIVVK